MAKLTGNVIAVDASVTSELIAEPNLTSTEDLRNLRPKQRTLQVAKTKNRDLTKCAIRNHRFCVI